MYSRCPKVWLGSQQLDVFPLSQSMAWITELLRISVVSPLRPCRPGRQCAQCVVVLAACLTLGLLVSSEWISQGGTGPGVVWAQEHTGPGVVWPGEGLVHSAALPDTGGVQTLRPGPRLAS